MARQLGPNIRAAYIGRGYAILVRPGDPHGGWNSTGTVRGSRRLIVKSVEITNIGDRRAYIFHGVIDGVEVETRALYGQNVLTAPGPGYVDSTPNVDPTRHFPRFDTTYCPDTAECARVLHPQLADFDCCECCGEVV